MVVSEEGKVQGEGGVANVCVCVYECVGFEIDFQSPLAPSLYNNN
jgi:hypothetical protein